jgi:hypothetical protein
MIGVAVYFIEPAHRICDEFDCSLHVVRLHFFVFVLMCGVLISRGLPIPQDGDKPRFDLVE